MEFDRPGERSHACMRRSLVGETTKSASHDAFHPDDQILSKYVTPKFMLVSIYYHAIYLFFHFEFLFCGCLLSPFLFRDFHGSFTSNEAQDFLSFDDALLFLPLTTLFCFEKLLEKLFGQSHVTAKGNG